MKFFLMAVFNCDRQFAVMSPRAKRVRYIPHNMVFIGQNLREKIVILFLADVSEGNIFRQKAVTFEFFHCGLNSGFGSSIHITPHGRTRIG